MMQATSVSANMMLKKGWSREFETPALLTSLATAHSRFAYAGTGTHMHVQGARRRAAWPFMRRIFLSNTTVSVQGSSMFHGCTPSLIHAPLLRLAAELKQTIDFQLRLRMHTVGTPIMV